MYTYMTEFAKTIPNGTRIEILFMKARLALHKYTTHRAMDGQVCFYRQSFADRVKPRRSTKWPMEPLMGTNKATWCVKLLPMTVWAYQVDWLFLCPTEKTMLLFVSLWMLLPAFGFSPAPTLPACPPPINFICAITGVEKNTSKTSSVR